MRCWLMIIACCLSLVTPAAAEPGRRPVTGLVLSGGGALGAAHIGVIKVLEELKIPVDLVVGTSMGSIVGGLYAMGLSAAEMDQLVGSIDWAGAFRDNPPRSDLSIRRKQDDYGFLLDLKVGIQNGAPQLPPGIIQGQRLTMLLRALTLRARSVNDFDALPIRYRAVAADLETGREVVLSHGNIATAMRASMSVPGVFPPVDLGGKLLVDGGVANNLPVDVARAMGAEVVIVVDLPTVLKTRDKIRSTVDVAGQMLSVLIQQNSLTQLRSLTPRDVLIQPDLGEMSAADFGRIRDAIPAGEAAARRRTVALTELAQTKLTSAQLASQTRQQAQSAARANGLAGGPAGDGATTKATTAAARTAPGGKSAGAAFALDRPRPVLPSDLAPPIIGFIEIVNHTKLADARIRRMIRQKIGHPLDPAQLEHDFAALYGQGDYEQIDYTLVERDGVTGMVVTASEKTWGKDYFRLGLSLEHDFSGRSSFTLGGGVTFTALDENGAEWRSEASIGAQQRLFTEYYQPLQPGPGWFLLPQAEYMQRNHLVFTDSGDAAAEYRLITTEARLLAGVELDSIGTLAGGLRFGHGDAKRLIGQTSPADQTFAIGAAQAMFTSDTFDNVNFPGEGHMIRSRFDLSSKSLGANQEYARVGITAHQAFTFGQTQFIVGGIGGSGFGDVLPLYDRFSAGGPFSVSGYARNEISGSNLLLGRLMIMQRMNESTPLAFNLPLYLGGTLEAAATDVGGGEGLAQRHYGASLFAAAATPLGPAYLGFGVGDGGRRAAWLFLGRPF